MKNYVVLGLISMLLFCSVGFTGTNVTEKHPSFHNEKCVSDNAVSFHAELIDATPVNCYSLPWEDNILVTHASDVRQFISIDKPTDSENNSYFCYRLDLYNDNKTTNATYIKHSKLIARSSGGLPYSWNSLLFI